MLLNEFTFTLQETWPTMHVFLLFIKLNQMLTQNMLLYKVHVHHNTTLR